MQIDADYTLEQYEEGNRFLLLNTTLNRKCSYYLMKAGYPVLAVVFLLLGLSIWTGKREFTSGVAELLFFAACMVFARLRFAAAVRKSYKLQERTLRSVLTLDENGFSADRKDGSAHGHFKWSAVDKWLERDTAFLLLLGPSSFIQIPSVKMSPTEREQVRLWLAETPQANK